MADENIQANGYSGLEDYFKNVSDEEHTISKQLHSLTFTYTNADGNQEQKNTWVDWHMIPSSRPSFAMPELKKYSQDIPGGNGEIDLTYSLTGYPAYKNRTGSIEFIVSNTGLLTSLSDPYGYNYDTTSGWQGIKSDIANCLHGRSLHIESEDMPGQYFKGRITVDEWKSNAYYSSITLKYDVEPFKYSITDSTNLWKWDPFNFRTGVIREYTTNRMPYTTDGTEFTVTGTIVPVVPTVYVTTEATVSTGNGVFDLSVGYNKNPLLQIYPSKQQWTFKAKSESGRAAIYFRERSL